MKSDFKSRPTNDRPDSEVMKMEVERYNSVMILGMDENLIKSEEERTKKNQKRERQKKKKNMIKELKKAIDS